jgi:hypothetical protein
LGKGKEPQHIFANPKNRGRLEFHRNVRAMAASKIQQITIVPVQYTDIFVRKAGYSYIY